MTTQQHNFRLTPNDWALVQEFAREHGVTPQQWVVNGLLADYARARGREWEGVRETAGNPNWVNPNQDVYTESQLEILRHVNKHGVLPNNANVEDVAKLRRWHLMRLEDIVNGIEVYNLRPAGYQALYSVNRCQCGTSARFTENGITCEICGKDLF